MTVLEQIICVLAILIILILVIFDLNAFVKDHYKEDNDENNKN